MRSKSGPGSTLYYYGLCELAQQQAVFVRKDKPPDRAIKSYRAKVVMTAGCISRNFDIPNYIHKSRERDSSANQNFYVTMIFLLDFAITRCPMSHTAIGGGKLC